MDYQFKTKPFDHQRVALKKSWEEESHALFMEMGTGKTKVIIDNIAMLHEAGAVDTVLIIAPKGVFDNWLRGEIPAHLPDRIDRQLLRWQPNHTKKFLADIKALTEVEFKGLKIMAMNIEGLSTVKAFRFAVEFLRHNPANMVVVDESTNIKNRDAKRTRNILQLRTLAKYRRLLTGSPVTKSPMDLFSQCEFLEPSCLGFNSYYAFQGRYANVQRRQMGPRQFNQIVGYKRLDELSEKLDQFSSRVLKDDCLDLPDKVYVRRDVPLPAEQTRMYAQMQKLALAQFDNGELSTTASVLTQIMRLQQICCGFLAPDDGDIQPIDSYRLPELMSVIEELQGKAIIWASYTYDIQQIAKALRDRFGPESVATYYGATAQDERQEIIEKFQDPDNALSFFVGQPRTGGFGITLTAAKTVIYYSNNYDLEIRLQSEDRAHRIGQTNKVTYIDLVTRGTIDEKILKALRNKINLASQALGEQARAWLL